MSQDLSTRILDFVERATGKPVQREGHVYTSETPPEYIRLRDPATSFSDRYPSWTVARRCTYLPVWWISHVQMKSKYKYRPRKGIQVHDRPGRPDDFEVDFEAYAIEIEGGSGMEIIHTVPDDGSSPSFMSMVLEQFREANRRVWGKERLIDQGIHESDLVLPFIKETFKESEPPYLTTLNQYLKAVIPGETLKQLAVLSLLQHDENVWKIPGMDEMLRALVRDPEEGSKSLAAFVYHHIDVVDAEPVDSVVAAGGSMAYRVY